MAELIPIEDLDIAQRAAYDLWGDIARYKRPPMDDIDCLAQILEAFYGRG